MPIKKAVTAKQLLMVTCQVGMPNETVPNTRMIKMTDHNSSSGRLKRKILQNRKKCPTLKAMTNASHKIFGHSTKVATAPIIKTAMSVFESRKPG